MKHCGVVPPPLSSGTLEAIAEAAADEDTCAATSMEILQMVSEIKEWRSRERAKEKARAEEGTFSLQSFSKELRSVFMSNKNGCKEE